MRMAEMKHGEFKKSENDLTLRNDFAKITERKDEQSQDNMLRLYCSQWPDNFTFQIRTFSPITDSGKPRCMIATTSLRLDDIKAMLVYAEKQAKRHD